MEPEPQATIRIRSTSPFNFVAAPTERAVTKEVSHKPSDIGVRQDLQLLVRVKPRYFVRKRSGRAVVVDVAFRRRVGTDNRIATDQLVSPTLDDLAAIPNHERMPRRYSRSRT